MAKILHRSLRWIVIYVLLLAAWCSCSCVCRRRSYRWKTVHVYYLGTVAQRFNPATDPEIVEQIEKYYFTHEKDNIMSVLPPWVLALGVTGKTWRECLSPERLERTRQ